MMSVQLIHNEVLLAVESGPYLEHRTCFRNVSFKAIYMIWANRGHVILDW